MVSTIKKILIYRMGAIGDVIHTLPLVRLLRQKQAEASIRHPAKQSFASDVDTQKIGTVRSTSSVNEDKGDFGKTSIEYIVGSQQLKDLLENYCPYIDRVHLVNKKTLGTDLEKISAGLVDEFIFLHSGWWKSWWLNWRFVHALKLVTYKRDDELSAVTNYVTSYFPGMKERLRHNAFAELEWHNVVLPKSEPLSQPYVCIVPGVGNLRPHRAYPLDKWFEFIQNLLDNTDYQIKILGGPDEIGLSKLIEQRLINLNSSRVENLIGQTSLTELAQILNRAEHLYSADTGILHVAAALGCKTTALFSITSPERFAPFSPGAKIIRAKNCLCEASTSNRPKHCSNLQNGYARCMYNVSLY